MSSPVVTRNAPITENCATSATALRWNITEALTQDKFLRNIEDPRCYSDMLQAIDPELLGLTVLQILKETKEDTQGCRHTQGTTNQNPFDERVHLCKVLKGFRVRTITININRIIGYIHVGDPNMKGGILIIE